jgi:replicative DNA helicase
MNKPEINYKWYNELAREVFDEDEANKEINKLTMMPTTFPLIDEMLDGGLRPGELAILSAPTKNGKTTLAQTITWNLASQGKSVLWFTMEMSWKELTRKFMGMDSIYKDGRRAFSSNAICYPLDNFRGGGKLQLDWLRDVIDNAKNVDGVGLVVIDHLHFLLPLKDYNTNISFLIGAIVREIKKIAVDLQIPIILIAHTKKLDIDKTPDINSIRDSSFIVQESDFTFIMWRIRSKDNLKKSSDEGLEQNMIYTNKTWLSLEANRRTGQTGRAKLWHDGVKFVPFTLEHKQQDDMNSFVDTIKTKVKQVPR